MIHERDRHIDRHTDTAIGVFRPISRFSSKTVKDTAIVTTKDELVCDLPTVPFPMTLSGP